MGKLEDRLNALERDVNYFKNASNRHEAILGERSNDYYEFKEILNEALLDIHRLEAKVHHFEDYHCDCPLDKEEEQEEEECEEEICPDCRENQMKEEFERQKQELKSYVRALGAALKLVAQQLEDLERA